MLVGAVDHAQSSPRTPPIVNVNTKRQSMICELPFPLPILGIKTMCKAIATMSATCACSTSSRP
ncbi:hypothetical protein D9611_013724 [Ephemerocybe angulata]|uniref:Uncharacterized protein n=1 Tax=Ephemerocybe angulata TaxID=980116 RepID=A0A8H5BC47_9AGAR|nr:hypothetical protein D9611_013724 [Tulosesus angulatus]